MAKLTAEQRRNLPKDVFGLPDERAYPMPDARHVINAITYFGSCEVSKRKILAKNINRLAKEYGVTVKLSPSSKFKPYADKTILREDAIPITEAVIPLDVQRIILTERMADIKHEVRTFNEFHQEYKNSNVDLDRPPAESLVNSKIDSAINVAIRNAAKNYLDKEYYLNGGKERTVIGDYVYDTDLKLCYDITRDFLYTKSVDDPIVVKKINMVHDKQMLVNAFSSVKNLMRKSPIMYKVIDDITEVINKSPDTGLIDNMESKFKATDFDKAVSFNFDSDMIVGSQGPEFRNFSETEISMIQEHIGVIRQLAASAIAVMCGKFGYPPIGDITRVSDLAVREMERRRIIDGYYMIDLAFIKMKDVIYCIVHTCNVENNHKCVVSALKIFDAGRPQYFDEVRAEFIRRRGELPKMPVRRITFCATDTCSDTETLTEGIDISKDGDISFKFSISKSYMDRYAALHKVLKDHEKNKDTDSMKHDLAYMFAMICDIEDKYVGKSKDIDTASSDYKDAIKARSFAINDMKRYMQTIHKKEKSFNFMKFYTDNEYDKKIFTIRHTTIAGMKNLLRIILA